MPIAFHRKKTVRSVSKQWIPPETHPQGFALARWKCGCDAVCFGAPVGPPNSRRKPWCSTQHVLGISSESKGGLRSNWYIYIEVSWNRGPQIIPILVGFSIINHPFLGTPMYGNIWLRIFPEVLGLHRSSRVAWHAPYFAHAHKLIWVFNKENYDYWLMITIWGIPSFRQTHISRSFARLCNLIRMVYICIYIYKHIYI